MKKLTLFYLFLYITHVILGPHFYLDSYFININPFFIKIEKPKYINHNLYNRIICPPFLAITSISLMIFNKEMNETSTTTKSKKSLNLADISLISVCSKTDIRGIFLKLE